MKHSTGTYLFRAIVVGFKPYLNWFRQTNLHHVWSKFLKSLEDSVLGFGQFTTEWFSSAPVPTGDGEVLVIQVDSKATPTATEEELEKRRGKRAKNPHPSSQRHFGSQTSTMW